MSDEQTIRAQLRSMLDSTPAPIAEAHKAPITVNGIAVDPHEINLESAQHEGGIRERQHQAAIALVMRELLRQRAANLDLWQEGEDIDTAIDTLLEQEVTLLQADEVACRQYFEHNRERFRTSPLVEVRHILLAAAPDDPDRRELERGRAEAMILDLTTHPGKFEAYASAHSACPSAAQGGHLGQIGKNQTVPEFESVVLRLTVGLATRPIETRYGFHVVEILAREEGAQMPFEEVQEPIASYLEERAWRKATHHYIQCLLAEAEVKGIELEIDRSPLLQ